MIDCHVYVLCVMILETEGMQSLSNSHRMYGSKQTVQRNNYFCLSHTHRLCGKQGSVQPPCHVVCMPTRSGCVFLCHSICMCQAQ